MKKIRLNNTISNDEIVAVLSKTNGNFRKRLIEYALLLFIRSDAGKAYLDCHGVGNPIPAEEEIPVPPMNQKDREVTRKKILGDFE